MPQLSIARLFEDNRDKLKLTWLAGRAGGARDLNSELIRGSSKGLIGHLNFIHPNWIQVLGQTEIEYLDGMDSGVGKATLTAISTRDLACFLVAGAEPIPAVLSARLSKPARFSCSLARPSSACADAPPARTT